MNEEQGGRIVFASFTVGVFVGVIVVLIASFNFGYSKYKQGQLDYQAGKIEWSMIDGKIHHIETP
jgi:hypothetical protein